MIGFNVTGSADWVAHVADTLHARFGDGHAHLDDGHCVIWVQSSPSDAAHPAVDPTLLPAVALAAHGGAASCRLAELSARLGDLEWRERAGIDSVM